MGYREALEAAGADVLDFETFGDYQGTWIAKVMYNGTPGWISGYYGSCSGCDAFEAEFEGSYRDEDDSYDRRLKAFGESYLHHIMSQQEVELEFVPEKDDWGDRNQIAEYVRKEAWRNEGHA